MIDFNKNNTAEASSPYVNKHKSSPIHWQLWSQQALDYAHKNHKLILVSSGYSTCHWCTVMDHDSFQDPKAAQFLNDHFVAIIIDREQRPDIDQYLVFYAIESQGTAGWPLNVAFTPEMHPFAAFTYLPPEAQTGIPSFLSVLQDITNFYTKHKKEIVAYLPPIIETSDIPQANLIPIIQAGYDSANGGFGAAPKFPPHATLLFLLNFFEHTNNQTVFAIVKKTLDVLATRALHDHLEGGFFRYCADEAWTIPHFEKMLYDQALLLWSYSAAYQAIKEPAYKTVAESIINFLENKLEHNGLLYSAVSSDTGDDNEGAMYLWDKSELATILSPEEFQEFSRVYTDDMNLHGAEKYPLMKSRLTALPDVETKLLHARNSREQPIIDTKIITSWNALTGIGLCMAHRYLDSKTALNKAERIFEKLTTTNQINNNLTHSSVNGIAQPEVFLEDYAALLLLATYLHEDTRTYEQHLIALHTKMMAFYKDGIWYEALGTDFINIPAQIIDHAIPASVSLALYAAQRTALLLRQELPKPQAYKQPLQLDFFNLHVFLGTENLHIIDAPHTIAWDRLPINTVQCAGPTFKHCIGTTCTEFKTEEELLNALTL